MAPLVGSIDQGTTSSRFILFDTNAQIVESHQMEHKQIAPQPGWTEHDPMEILRNVQTCIDKTMGKAAAKGITVADVKAIGITNQRETTVAWDRTTGQPLYNAIVWHDLRTSKTVSALKEAHPDKGQDAFRDVCGLPISTYFAGVKMKWMLENVEEVKAAADSGTLAMSTIDCWLLWNLTGGPNGGVYATDVSNACRTMLMDLTSCAWHPPSCSAFGVDIALLPRIVSNSENLGSMQGTALANVPICGMLGDQQAALVGQRCFQAGRAKNTYGTGCFLLMNTGETPVPSTHGLLTTVGYQLGPDQKVTYALEGSVPIAGAAVQWLRDNLGIITSAKDTEALASSVPDAEGVVFVPAFAGLFAPYWHDEARGLMIGLTSKSNKAHLCRAVLDAVSFQSKEVLDAMQLDSSVRLDVVQVDGGMTANNLLMQTQANVLGVPVVRPAMVETTALGSAVAAGLCVGVWSSKEAFAEANAQSMTKFEPTSTAEQREKGFKQWLEAVKRSMNWASV